MKKDVKNQIHMAIHGTPYRSYKGGDIPQQVRDFMNFLSKKYHFYDIAFVTSHIYNVFMLAMDKKNRMLFIKTCKHPDLCRNEYVMGRALWEMDHKHFLEPLYYSDSGDFYFFANEIMYGDSLQRISDYGKLKTMSCDRKMRLVRDLYQIFIDLKKSDIVHRDIRPANFAVINGRLVLIDFQLAVSKSHYVELESMNAKRLRGLGSRKYRYKTWHWDDSYSLLKCLQFIGCPCSKYKDEYNKIKKEIKSYIGHDVIKSSKRENFIERFVRHLTKKTRNNFSTNFLSVVFYGIIAL